MDLTGTLRILLSLKKQMGIALLIPFARHLIPYTPIQLSQIHPIDLALCNLAHNPRRPSRYHGETGYHHIWRHHAALEDPHIVLDDCELADYAVGADPDVAAYQRGFDDRACADEDVVCHFDGVVGEYAGRSQLISEHVVYWRERHTLCVSSLAASTRILC